MVSSTPGFEGRVSNHSVNAEGKRRQDTME